MHLDVWDLSWLICLVEYHEFDAWIFRCVYSDLPCDAVVLLVCVEYHDRWMLGLGMICHVFLL